MDRVKTSSCRQPVGFALVVRPVRNQNLGELPQRVDDLVFLLAMHHENQGNEFTALVPIHYKKSPYGRSISNIAITVPCRRMLHSARDGSVQALQTDNKNTQGKARCRTVRRAPCGAAVEGEDSRWQRDMDRASQGKNLSR